MTVSVEYLVVAGGGGGGAGGGGGGGGGVLAGTSTLSTLTNYTVTVGTEGSGGPLNAPNGATKGNNSVFNDQTALGGGPGGGTPNSGGSGGGGGYGYNMTGGAGTVGQGNNGGNGGSYGGGGGGGAGGVGQNGTSVGGTGGLGFTSSISGTAVTYGGGGGGGQNGVGTDGGGNGGFGDGQNTQTEGATNRGGGGGGGGNGGTYAVGRNGGSGVVILKYPLSNSLTGGQGLTFTTAAVSGFNVTTFTGGSGNIQFTSADPGLTAPTSIIRGNSFDVTLVTENVADNTTIPYTITGVTSADLNGDPLSGNFTIVGNSDVITIQTANIPLVRTMTLSAKPGETFVFQNVGFAYSVNGYAGNFPTLTLYKGRTYTFDFQAVTSSHPIALRLASGDTSAVPGTTGNNAASGVHGSGATVTYAVPLDAPSSIVYQCVVHGSMIGTINLVEDPNDLSVQITLNGGKPVDAELLVVAGGGSGGNHSTTNANGGGGAGGLLHSTGLTITNGIYNVIVGAGGTRVANATAGIGNKGQNSSFGGYVAQGGGGGGSTGVAFDAAKMNGGSGGGHAYSQTGGGAATQTDTVFVNSTGYGNAGGTSSVTWTGAGGGGAGSVGVNGATTAPGGNGGAGLSFDISGTTTFYAGGGGGGGNSSERAGDGFHGGGRGFGTTSYYAYNSYPASTINSTTLGSSTPDAVVNTGGGGGGGSYWAPNGGWTLGSGQGGSGVVIIRYAGGQIATGGVITTVGSDTVHTFATSGTIEFASPAYASGLNVDTPSVYNGDSIEIVYVDQTQADNATVPYTITGVTSSDINSAALTGNFTISAGIAYLTLTASNVVSKTLTITAGGESLNVTLQYAITVRYLAVAGGGGGGMDMGGGGGGGGLLKSSSIRVPAGSINIEVGAGGTGAPTAGTGPGTQGATAHQYTIPATAGQNTVFGNLATAVGGGTGGSSYYPYTPGAAGGSGGSGGGSSGYSDGRIFPGGTATTGQGFRGGQGGGAYYSGGGGGAGGPGTDSTAQANGGPGLEDNILGTAYYWAGGGGGSGYSIQGGNGGIGGGGGGAVGTTTGGAGLNAGQAGGGGTTSAQTNKPGGNGGANTGGGGGGGSHYTATNQGGNGGSGIVVVRYSGGQKAVGGTVTTVTTDTVHTFTTSGTLTVFPGEGLSPSTPSAYFGDTFTVYLTANEPDSTTVPYTITGVTSAEINNAGLTGNFTVTGGIASLEIVTVAGTQDTKTFSITAYGYTITVALTYVQSFTIPRTSSGWGINQVFTLVTRNLPDSTTVPYTITGVTSADLNSASLTGNITITGNQGTLTVVSDPLLLTSKTLTVTIPGGFAESVALTFVTVPVTETTRTISIEGLSVTPTDTADLSESGVNSQAWTETYVEEHRFLSSIDGVNVIPTNIGDLAEQVTVAVAIGDMPRVEDPKEVRMAGISASPTYVYTDGAPIAAPDPSLTLTVEQWTIT